jgi:hypothetical protein
MVLSLVCTLGHDPRPWPRKFHCSRSGTENEATQPVQIRILKTLAPA